jgi:predicted dinucleotide-binding enzyme
VKKYLSGKTVIDTTNPIADAPPQNGVLRFFTNLDESLMERLQKVAPDAQFIKAFNSVGSGLMINPDFRNNTKPTMFICGNNDDAKKKVYEILERFGFETEDMGKAEKLIEEKLLHKLSILLCSCEQHIKKGLQLATIRL